MTKDNRLEEFRAYRDRMNERILATDHLGIKRFFNLDTAAYRDGPLEAEPRSCWDWWPRPCYGVMTVSITTLFNVWRPVGVMTNCWMLLTWL